ncbi:general secretion pathway protein GspK [Synoicihabitans lomoniglobus]|uniref:Type II secretion system protein GspK n=1 Tax=Synoicihabitans lomoniglobus TaxID=2909285 RepID=A0AAE9ZYQ0_9BACT|nr:general secretion pathway protein GspK [Opitutaceae bacterium LMO-M01]WED65684.1 type II secretion system protein GspK [Opitutaceae bacterium LMO-M01]
MRASILTSWRRKSRRASVLIIVLVTLVFATTALLLFIERASTDLIVHVRDADRMRLRQEAYSALETTMAVLLDFKEVIGGLHSPAEGWGDPLDWTDYEPGEGLEVSVEFVDESGKISVGQLTQKSLYDLFFTWGETQSEAELWADAIMGWMEEDYTPVSFEAPEVEDYERGDLAFRPPWRRLRSFEELRAIDVIREAFFTPTGLWNEKGRRFKESVSLFNYSKANVNSAPESVLAALGGFDRMQQELLSDYRGGIGLYQGNGPGFFTDAGEVSGIVGEGAGADAFSTEISALRIIVTVKQNVTEYRLNVVISPNGAASTVRAEPIPRKGESRDTTSEEAAADAEATAAQAAGAPEQGTATAKRVSAAELVVQEDSESENLSLEYPFTLLEIREIDAPEHLAPPPLTEAP